VRQAGKEHAKKKYKEQATSHTDKPEYYSVVLVYMSSDLFISLPKRKAVHSTT
jgi:hypothetical protein